MSGLERGPTRAPARPTSVAGSAYLRLRLTPGRVVALVAGLAAIVLGIVVIGPGTQPGLPLDPRSTEPNGLAGLVDLLGQLDVEVTIDHEVPTDPATTVFLPVDQLSTEHRDEVRAFAHAGGTLVVAGAGALAHDLTPAHAPLSDMFGSTTFGPSCEELPQVRAVRHSDWQAMEVPDDATACFPSPADDGTAWLVSVPHGEGRIIALGSGAPFTNQLLDEDDNAVLAVSLLGPAPGDEVVVIPRPEVGEGDTPLLELVPDGVWRGVWLLVAAVVVAALWRGRRLGAPVEERLPPVLPSAELARSVGHLFQRVGDRDAAARRLRSQLRRELRQQLGAAPTLPSAELAELTASRTAVALDDAHLALVDTPVADDRALTDLAAAVARVRHDARRSPDRPETTTSPPNRSVL